MSSELRHTTAAWVSSMLPCRTGSHVRALFGRFLKTLRSVLKVRHIFLLLNPRLRPLCGIPGIPHLRQYEAATAFI
jgi:hypothetical protein